MTVLQPVFEPSQQGQIPFEDTLAQILPTQETQEPSETTFGPHVSIGGAQPQGQISRARRSVSLRASRGASFGEQRAE
eukprot:2640262-Pyramimonas_sp.AAC.1